MELDNITGSGKDGRVTKKDILAYVANRSSAPAAQQLVQPVAPSAPAPSAPAIDKPIVSAPVDASGGSNVEIIEMDRMRRLIADHMVNSKHTSPHVTSFVEADVTPIVEWRNRNKQAFQQKFGEKITFTPISLRL